MPPSGSTSCSWSTWADWNSRFGVLEVPLRGVRMSSITPRLARLSRLDVESLRPAAGSTREKQLRQTSERVKAQALQAYAMRSYGRALSAYEQLTDLQPWDLKAWLRLGDCLSRLDRVAEAVETYRLVARQLAERGRLGQAASAYRLIVELDPFDAGATAALQHLERKRERTESSGSIAWMSDAFAPAMDGRLPWSERVLQAATDLLHSEESGLKRSLTFEAFLKED